jgi:hypothetical protein
MSESIWRVKEETFSRKMKKQKNLKISPKQQKMKKTMTCQKKFLGYFFPFLSTF